MLLVVALAAVALLTTGGVMLAVCGGYQLVGRYYRPAEGEVLQGVGLIDLWTEHAGPGTRRLIGNLVIAVEGMDEPLIGFENHGGRTHLGPGAQPAAFVLERLPSLREG